MACLLVKSLVTSTLVTQPAKNGYGVERIIHYSYYCPHLGHLLKMSEDPFPLDSRGVVDIWEKGSTRASQTMALVCLLYFCAAYHNINLCIVHVPGVCNDIADSLSLGQIQKASPTGKSATSLYGQHNPSWMPPTMPLSWYTLINLASLSVRMEGLTIILLKLQYFTTSSIFSHIPIFLC